MAQNYLDALTRDELFVVSGQLTVLPITAAIAEQAATLIHTSNLFEVPLANGCCAKIG